MPCAPKYEITTYKNVGDGVHTVPIGDGVHTVPINRVHTVPINHVPKYEIIIYWSKEDGCYLAEVPELPGCMADGQSLKEAVENAEIIIREWIECAIEDGETIPKPRGRLMYA